MSEKNPPLKQRGCGVSSLEEIQNQLSLNNLLTEQSAVFGSALKRELDRAIFKGPYHTKLVRDSVQSTRKAKMSSMSYI